MTLSEIKITELQKIKDLTTDIMAYNSNLISSLPPSALLDDNITKNIFAISRAVGSITAIVDYKLLTLETL